MEKKNSTMSPKRLIILLCLAGLVMWVFSNTELETEVSIDLGKDKVEEVDSVSEQKEDQIQKEEIVVKKKKKKKVKKRSSEMKQNNTDYLKKRELNYDPNTRNIK